MKYLIIIGLFIVGFLGYMAFEPDSKSGVVPVYESYVPARTVTPTTQTPTTTQPKTTTAQPTQQPTQSTSKQKAIENLKNTKAPTFAPPVMPEVKPLPTVPKTKTCQFTTDPITFNQVMICN